MSYRHCGLCVMVFADNSSGDILVILSALFGTQFSQLILSAFINASHFASDFSLR